MKIRKHIEITEEIQAMMDHIRLAIDMRYSMGMTWDEVDYWTDLPRETTWKLMNSEEGLFLIEYMGITK